MSDREQCNMVLDALTGPQLASAAVMLRALKRVFDDMEDADEAFCKQMEADYEVDPDRGDFMSLEDFAKTLGITV